MQKFIQPGRVAALFVAMAAILTIYTTVLYKLQLAGKPYDAEIRNTMTTTTEITAPRGDILDRNGVLLVSNRASYNVTLSRSAILANDSPNDLILDIVRTAGEYGVSHNDTFPITVAAPFNYVANMTGLQRDYLSQYLDYFHLDQDISASDLFVWMKDHYGIDYTTRLADARTIMGIRYELELRVIINIDRYIFAEDVDTDFIAVLRERGYSGVGFETTTVREYYTDYAAHVLGYVGYIAESEYDYYKKLDYPMNALVGQDGVEKAFEQYLHGTSGVQYVTMNREGTVLDVTNNGNAHPGSNVYLTLDIGMQKVAEDSLARTINQMNADRKEGEKSTGGAVVVVGVGTGEVYASASYPTYSLSSFMDNYSRLVSDPTSPLVNRATQGAYNPGSTFKMVTALAGLRTGVIDRNTTVFDSGVYTAYEDEGYSPSCWIYPTTGAGHGYLDVVGALENSCNYFFFWVGDNMGIRPIAQAATDFGLAQKTGIEIYEETGTLATPEYKKSLDETTDWYAADTLITAIGQGYNTFTPIQLANYCSTIASNGTRYKLTLLKTVKDADYNEILYKKTPEVMGDIKEKNYIAILKEGMEAVATTEDVVETFSGCPVDIACKTGTVQSWASETNNGVFVCYAPAKDPEIAISVVVEKGVSGSKIMVIAKDILDYYYSGNAEYGMMAENTLQP